MVQLAGSATCAGASPEYRFFVRRPGETAFAEARPYSTDPRAPFFLYQLVPGRYEFKVWVRAVGNASDWEAAAAASVFVGPTCTSASLRAAFDGYGMVDLSAGASCTFGRQPQFRFMVRRPGASAFTEVRPYDGSSRFQYWIPSPVAPGRYEFQVQVRAYGNSSDYEASASASAFAGATCSSALLAAALVPPGGAPTPPVALTASALCGVATPEYRFLVRRPGEGSFSQLGGWGTSPTAAVSPGPAGLFGKYDFQVQVRAKGNLSDYEATASAVLFVGASCSSASLDARVDSGSGLVNLAADSTCRSDATAEYRFLQRRPGEAAFAELRPWGPDPRAMVVPQPFEPGRWEFQVQVRAAGNVSAFEASATSSTLLGQGCAGASLSVMDAGGEGCASSRPRAACGRLPSTGSR